MDLRHAIAVLRCSKRQVHGVVRISELRPNGLLRFRIRVVNIPPGKHGFHLHRSGNDLEGPSGLCAHYNPTEMTHGGLNDPSAHRGDFGNLECDSDGICETSFISRYLTMDEVLGRSLVVHEDEDDLGRGDWADSSTTGHSGARILWGIVGVDELCD